MLHTSHERLFETNRFVYPVLSRRSQGVSVGINLNPNKVCNFDCIYCQVDRTTTSETRFVEMDQLLTELDDMLSLLTSGELFRTERFSLVPIHLQRLNDIAFSGDGEPTTYKNFDEIISACAELKEDRVITPRPMKDLRTILFMSVFFLIIGDNNKRIVTNRHQ